MSAERVEVLEEKWTQNFPSLALSEIGWLCPENESMGSEIEEFGGWDHFQIPVAN